MDQHTVMVLVRDDTYGRWDDYTERVSRVQPLGERTMVSFTDGRSYHYRSDRVRVFPRVGDDVELGDSRRVEVNGAVCHNATRVGWFLSSDHVIARVSYGSDERSSSHPASEVRIVASPVRPGSVSEEVFSYLHRVVDCLGDAADGRVDPIRPVFNALTFVHPDSVLARYLSAAPIEKRSLDRSPIFPFSSNLSQTQAVRTALMSPISIIEGPPGTGKTQTILNLVATLVASPGTSVGVVSLGNAAVDNVREKLEAEGLGFLVANLGRADRRAAFFADQPNRRMRLETYLTGHSDPGRVERLADIERRLSKAQQHERDLKKAQQLGDALRLERQHMSGLVERQGVSQVADIPLLRRSPQRILDFLVETELAGRPSSRAVALARKLRRLAKYGPHGGLDVESSETVIGLQLAYIDRCVTDIDRTIARLGRSVRRDRLRQLEKEYERIARSVLRAGIVQRYAHSQRPTFDERTYNRTEFRPFIDEYPVILSSCHSLRRSIGPDHLLDYLIIDEASQVDLLTGAVALACCRNVVVVGDLKQLEPVIDNSVKQRLSPPSAAYDYTQRSIMSSLRDLYGPRLPVTLLREHYRCDPAIIGFCNEKFYRNELIPFTQSKPGARPLIVHRTVEGNHMRSPRSGGHDNQREAEVIEQEVIPSYCDGVEREDIGLITPYRAKSRRSRRWRAGARATPALCTPSRADRSEQSS